MVSNSLLVNRLREFLWDSDIETTTAASVHRRLEEEFAVDLHGRRAFIREQIDLALQNRDDDAELKEEIDKNGVVQEEKRLKETGGDSNNSQCEEEEEEEEEVKQEVYDDGRSKRKKSTSIDAKKKGSDFTKTCALSPQLEKFLGVAELSRTEVVKRIWAYIGEHNLQDPTNKRNIKCDDSLHGIFCVKSIDMFQMNKALSKHIWPMDDEGEMEIHKKIALRKKMKIETPESSPALQTTQSAPRIQRPHPSSSSSATTTQTSSTGVPNCPPPILFMPVMVPSIPKVDDGGVPQPSSLITPLEAYTFESWPENMRWHSCRKSKTKLIEEFQNEMKGGCTHGSGEKKKKKKTRGTAKGVALNRHVSKYGRHVITLNQYGRPDPASEAVTAYSRNIGFIIRDRVPILWAEWKDVALCVKDRLNNAMATWFDIPLSLLNTWCDEEQTIKYRSWKNELHLFWTIWGNLRESTPEEFKFREYEWKWLRVHFCDPNYMAISTTNSSNRAGLKELHSLGSRSLARVSHDAACSDNVDNPFVYISQKAYPNNEHEKVREESDKMLTKIATEQNPDLAEKDLALAIGDIDLKNPYIRARIWGTIYPPKGSHFHTPMMGAEGNKLLKNVPDFQRSRRQDSQKASLEEQLRSEKELRARQFSKFQEEQKASQRAMLEQQRAMISQQQQMMQYMMTLSRSMSQMGLPIPPPPLCFDLQTPQSTSQHDDKDSSHSS